MIREIEIPFYINEIKTERKNFPSRYKLFGGDTETYFSKKRDRQEVFMFQMAHERQGKLICDVVEVTAENALDKFLDYLEKNITQNNPNFVYFHNLNYDVVALLMDSSPDMAQNFFASKFEFDLGDWNIRLIHGRANFCFMKYQGKTMVYLLDSFAFYKTSLSKLCDTLGLPYKKLKRPDKLGEKKFSIKDKKFLEYAKVDAYSEYYVGKHIMDLHQDSDIFPCVSIAQMAQRIFKKEFIKEDSKIRLPHIEIIRASVLSYHGGRNYFNGKHGVYKNIRMLDIVSAYPDAMKSLPCFCDNGEYTRINNYKKYAIAIYCISGEILEKKYRCLMSHEGVVIQDNKFHKIWTTCFELETMKKHNSIRIEKIHGIEYANTCDHYPQLSGYVDKYFALKNQTKKTDTRYDAYKLLLNALYGKFIQCIKQGEHDGATIIEVAPGEFISVEPRHYTAGGLFNPFIASLITGHTRAKLYNLMLKYQAIHASTDSVMTQQKIESSDLGKNLGDLTVEMDGCTCILLRNKLYLFTDKTGKLLEKCALHGFLGTRQQLHGMIQRGNNTYRVRRMVKILQSLRSTDGVAPLVFQDESRELKLDFLLDKLPVYER